MDDEYSYYDDDDYEEEEEEEEEEGNKDLGFLNVSDFVDKEDDGVRETVVENIGRELGFSFAVNKNEKEKQEEEEEDPEEFERKSKQLQEAFSSLPSVLIKRILRRDDVKGNIEKASTRLQEFQDMENPAALFKIPTEERPLTTKPEGKFERKPRKQNQTQVQHGDAERQDERRNIGDSVESDQNEGNQTCRGHNSRQRGKARGGPQRGPRGRTQKRDSGARPKNTHVYSDDQGQWFGHQNASPQRRDPVAGPRGGSRGQNVFTRGGTQRRNPGAGPNNAQVYCDDQFDPSQGQWFGHRNALQRRDPEAGFRGRSRGQNTSHRGGTQRRDPGAGSNNTQAYSYDQFHPPQGRWFGHQNAFLQRGDPEARPRGGTRGQNTFPRGGTQKKSPGAGPSNTQVYRHDQFQPPQGRWFGHQNTFPPQRGRGNQRGQRGGGFLQDQIAGYRDNSPYGSQEWRFGDGGNFQPKIERGGQSGRGRQPNPKSKPKGYGRGGNFQEQHQIPGNFQESDQFPDPKDSSQIMPRQPNQPSERGRNFREKQKHTVSSRKPVSKITSSPCSVDDSDAGKVADQSQFETNKILIRGLSGKTSRDGLSNFIAAKSAGQEVNDVQMLKNGKALVIMADEIRDFTKIKTKCEERGLDDAKVSIEQIPVCKSILVTGFSDVTHDFIQLYFESRRNGGGPVDKVDYVPKSGRAVVVFQNAIDMERVLTRHEEKPHEFEQTQLSIRVYREFLEDEEVDGAEDSGDLGATATAASESRVSQKPDAKAQRLEMSVDPDVMEYVTFTGFQAELNNSLTGEKSEITWKPNDKIALIVYRGEDDSDSWQSECIDQVQNYLSKFAKCDVQVNKDFWEAVVAKVPSIRTCLGVDPPLVKTIPDSNVARIISLKADVKSNEEKVKSKLEEIYREETRKTYLKKKIADVPEERLILLKKIKFTEKLQEKNKELEIKINTEGEEIYFEGPQPQFTEATMEFEKLLQNMVEKKVTLSVSILEILNSDKGLQTVKCELERNNVEAVLVIDKDATIVGSSAAHADNAAKVVNKLMVEEKVQVDEKSKHLLKSSEWLKLCGEMHQTAVRVRRDNWNDTYVAGFRNDVTEVIKKLNTFLKNNRIEQERFVCGSDIMRRYLLELRHEDLRTIENQLKDFVVSIKKGKDDDDFVISGNTEGLKRVGKKIKALMISTDFKTFEVKQPGLPKLFDGANGDRLVKSVEKEQDCAIKVQKSFGRGGQDEELHLEGVSNDSTSSGDRDDDVEDEHATTAGTDPSTLVIAQRHRVSWKPGKIEAEKADVLVSSQGACYQAIINAGGPQAVTPNVGDITVSGGFSLVSYVIHTNCCTWNNGGGEPTLRAIVKKCLQTGETLGANSIAFPVIGTGNLQFPRDAASRIMLEETVNFCRANPGSNLRDIRFVVFNQDQALTAAFKQEMNKLQPKHIGHSAITTFTFTSPLNVEVVNGDLTRENSTDAIMNIISTDMKMDNAGDLSKAIARQSGPLVQQECNQLGKQPPGTAIMTSGGNLQVPHIIHIIPSSSDKEHLQKCLEKGLHVADANYFQAISIPCIGTGGYGLNGADSAQLTFKALNAFSTLCKNIKKVRVVVFQASMMQEFLQEQKKQPVQGNEGDTDSENAAARETRSRGRRQELGQSDEHSVRISVIGKDKVSVGKAVESLKKGFSDACTMGKVENEIVSQLSDKQKDILRKKAKDRDVKLEIEDDVDRIVVRGGPAEVPEMVGEIWKEINERKKKKQEEEQAKLLSKNVEWSYEIRGTKVVFASKENAKIELAHSKDDHTVQVSLRGDKFVIDLKRNSGFGQRSGEQITLIRKVKGADEGIALPKHWAPMPGHDSTAHKVQLLPGSPEYQDVVGKFQATAGALNIQKIERVQNPHLYQSYMVRKQKMDKDTRANSEKQLFHGTDAKNINHINTQGFNRSFCGAHGTAYGRGVYFARDAQYSVNYAGRVGCGSRHMYLAKVLVGQYCVGNRSMVVPPPKDPSKPEILYDSVVNNQSSPSIFVVFFDNQCYPEYLITFS